MAKQQKTTFKIPKGYTPEQRRVIAQDIMDLIVKRTREQSIDKNGIKFKGYSKAYKESLDFKNAGKTGKVNLTLSREMLNSMELLQNRSDEIVIGYNKDNTELNGKVEGNRLGTYGNSKPVTKGRDFLGLPDTILKKIIQKYPLSRPNILNDRIAKGLAGIKEAEEIVKDGIETQPFQEA